MSFWNLFRRPGTIRRRHRNTDTIARRRLELEVLEDRSLPSATSLGLVTGTVFIDHNANGRLDAGELGVSGVVVTLSGTTSQHATVKTTATTNLSGLFSFQNVAPGTYTLSAGPSTFLVGRDAVSGISVAAGQFVNENLGFLGLAPAFISNDLFLASTTTANFSFPAAGPGSGLLSFPANTAPTVSAAIGPVSVKVNSADTAIDLAGHFTDPGFTNSQVTLNTSDGPLNVTLF